MVMLDCGATHNFVIENLGADLELSWGKSGGLLGLGKTIKGKGFFEE